ncbi:MAG: hypothetical protein HOV79_00330 [Hamadaea sp.]|nr:hypothetical protein [Hamadaea sp.]
MSLREAAHAQANGHPAAEPGDTVNVIAPLPDVEYSGPISDPEKVPVAVAFARVMADVQAVSKKDRRDDVGGKYNFRGIDRVVNAVGPALRRHGVLMLPVKVFDVEYRETRTSKGTVMQECTLKVKWLVIGPNGDAFPEQLESAGQATDTQDKATSKATSVAQRVLFLSSLHIPTENPDVDKGYDRGERPTPRPAEYVDEVCDPRTSPARLKQIWAECKRHNLLAAIVTNETGDEEQLSALITRMGQERGA